MHFKTIRHPTLRSTYIYIVNRVTFHYYFKKKKNKIKRNYTDSHCQAFVSTGISHLEISFPWYRSHGCEYVYSMYIYIFVSLNQKDINHKVQKTVMTPTSRPTVCRRIQL